MIIRNITDHSREHPITQKVQKQNQLRNQSSEEKVFHRTDQKHGTKPKTTSKSPEDSDPIEQAA
jgi:hypothetical protein